MSESQSNQDGVQPLIGHLIELRDRILRALMLVLVIFLCLFYFANDLYAYMSDPLTDLLPPGSTMIATDVTAPFFAPFKLTLVLSIFIAIPFILHQAWSFIAPGLYQHEKRMAIPLLFSSILLFYAGVAFAYYAVFPIMFGFFTTIGPEHVAVTPDISSFLNLVLKLFFAFGVVFEIPVATLLLIWSGAVSAQTLAAKRPYVIVCCFVVGMFLTPPDIISQSLLAVPMWLLFESGLILGRIFVRRSAKAESESTE